MFPKNSLGLYILVNPTQLLFFPGQTEIDNATNQSKDYEDPENVT